MGSQLGMTRPYARSFKGQRAPGSTLRNRGSNTTTIGALNHTGIQAAFVFEGATDKAAFMTFITEVSVPTLQPGRIVVMDNLGAHRVKAVQAAIEAAGYSLKFTPPYSPEFAQTSVPPISEARLLGPTPSRSADPRSRPSSAPLGLKPKNR